LPNAIKGCTACGDTAVPLRILKRSGSSAFCIDKNGATTTVALDFVPDARAGDRVLVHFGVAIARVADPS